MWEPGARLHYGATAVMFKLNPHLERPWTVWKASAEAPLLVYDPRHTGEIISAQQLFGEWAFGGQRVASANSHIVPQPWQNGFDALATLDRNGDKQLTEAELEPLALWFDANRNAISEPGEVRSAKEVGLLRLAVTPNKNDAVAQTVTATNGFDRSVPAGIVSGDMVDWWSPVAASPAQLVSQFLTEKALEYPRGHKSTKDPTSQKPMGELSANIDALEGI